jgi:hypothetical protein
VEKALGAPNTFLPLAKDGEITDWTPAETRLRLVALKREVETVVPLVQALQGKKAPQASASVLSALQAAEERGFRAPPALRRTVCVREFQARVEAGRDQCDFAAAAPMLQALAPEQDKQALNGLMALLRPVVRDGAAHSPAALVVAYATVALSADLGQPMERVFRNLSCMAEVRVFSCAVCVHWSNRNTVSGPAHPQ